MGTKDKAICSWDKADLKDSLAKLKELVRDAKYICKKCGRAANSKEHLCKPEKL